MSKMYKMIKYPFEEHPIITNSLVCGIFFAGAEFSRQRTIAKILYSPQPCQGAIIGINAAYGTLIWGPFSTIWYRWLDKTFHGSSAKMMTKKILLDTFLFGSAMALTYCGVIIAVSLWKPNISEAFQIIRQHDVDPYCVTCAVWPAVQITNFGLIPSVFRIPFNGACQFIWMNIMCWIKANSLQY